MLRASPARSVRARYQQATTDMGPPLATGMVYAGCFWSRRELSGVRSRIQLTFWVRVFVCPCPQGAEEARIPPCVR